jgi:hypothetical protein
MKQSIYWGTLSSSNSQEIVWILLNPKVISVFTAAHHLFWARSIESATSYVIYRRIRFSFILRQLSSPDPWYALLYLPKDLALLIPPSLATLIQQVALIHCYILQPLRIDGFTLCNFGHARAILQYGLKYRHLSLSGPILNLHYGSYARPTHCQ